MTDWKGADIDLFKRERESIPDPLQEIVAKLHVLEQSGEEEGDIILNVSEVKSIVTEIIKLKREIVR